MVSQLYGVCTLALVLTLFVADDVDGHGEMTTTGSLIVVLNLSVEGKTRPLGRRARAHHELGHADVQCGERSPSLLSAAQLRPGGLHRSRRRRPSVLRKRRSHSAFQTI